mmetsp:Transcript_6753/g.17295  ORF Transcript_6753/g.17295 Transcript_6753/m.17295 type:complete len:227 (+) Transcript_6753:986-1666(+)
MLPKHALKSTALCVPARPATASASAHSTTSAHSTRIGACRAAHTAAMRGERSTPTTSESDTPHSSTRNGTSAPVPHPTSSTLSPARSPVSCAIRASLGRTSSGSAASDAKKSVASSKTAAWRAMCALAEPSYASAEPALPACAAVDSASLLWIETTSSACTADASRAAGLSLPAPSPSMARSARVPLASGRTRSGNASPSARAPSACSARALARHTEHSRRPDIFI